MSRLGIIAAKGNLSKALIEEAAQPFFVVAIEGEADPDLIAKTEHVWIKLGEIGKAVNALKDAGVEKIVFVGSLKKPDILSLKVDWLGAKLVAQMIKNKFFGDNNLLSMLVNFLETQGFEVVGAHQVLKNLTVEAKIFTKLKPNTQDKIDIELAKNTATELGRFDIGQGAIVQNGIVLGVEAIEGTDALIKRCGELKRDKALAGVLLKISKPNQELRMDLPTIGIQTIKNLHAAGFKGLMIQAHKSIFLDQQKVIDYANEHKMFVGAF